MRTRRSQIIGVGILLAVLGTAIPLGAMAWISWHLAVEKELEFLDLFGSRAMHRARAAFDESFRTLSEIEASGLEPCSEAHIARMRRLVIDSLIVSELGYFENGYLKCTSWGMTSGRIHQARAHYTTPEGMAMTIRMDPAITQGKAVSVLQFGHHNALIAPIRFVDILLEQGMSVTLMTGGGQVINTLGPPDLDFARMLARNDTRGLDADRLFVVGRSGDLVAVTTSPRGRLDAQFHEELMFLLPVGAFIALFIVGIVAWLSRARLSPRAELEIALRRREFVVHYQPIIALADGACIGAEALVRWRQSDGSLVRPDLFIPLAEETGLIRPLTDQVVAGMVADLGALLAADHSLHVTLNVCADDICTGRILDVLCHALSGTDIRPHQVWLEMTERGFVAIEAARGTLERARATGHKVAIDDFGTGYSNLQYLHGLPVDALKIDKAFVETIGLDTPTSSVTDHIIGMARELGLATIAEGIETEAQAAYLRARAVDFGQGWLIARAMPAGTFLTWLEESRKAGAGVAGHAPAAGPA